MKHPYKRFENTKLWIAVESAVQELIKNSDLQLTTAPQYVVGSICKSLADAQLVKVGARSVPWERE